MIPSHIPFFPWAKSLFFLIAFSLSFGGRCQQVKVSDFGFNGTDDTTFVLQALRSDRDTIIFDKQDSSWVVGPLKFKGLKNKVIVFEKGTVLMAKEKAFPNTTDALLAFEHAENITIMGNGTTLAMNKAEYVTGEWRHGISLRSCKDIAIEQITIRDSGGDGIYIGTMAPGGYSENITIDNLTATNNKRQGMSVISVKNLKVSHSVFQHTGGTLPGAGVDLEPNSKEDRLENITFEHCVFKNNDHAGILLALQHLETESVPVDIRFLNCVLQNNHSKENKYPASEIVVNAHKTRPVQGAVVFDQCLVENSQWGLLYSRKVAEAYKVVFTNCTARNICLEGTYPAIYLEVPDYRQGSHTLGGFVFDNLYLAYEAAAPYLQVRGSKFFTLRAVADITGTITLESHTPKSSSYLQYSPDNNRNVRLRVTHK